MKKIESRHVISNMIWRFLESSGSEIIQFVISIILARLLDPSAYGMIAIVVVLTSILRIFIDSGFGAALVQNKNSDEIDFSSVFYFNIIACFIMYIFLYIFAPWIANFYRIEGLIPVIRVLGLSLLTYGVRNVQQAYVSKHLQFKRLFVATLIGTLFSSFIGIGLAYKGYGVWALVWQQLSSGIVCVCILWLTVQWHPKLKFSFYRIVKLFNFGWKMLISATIDRLYNSLRTLIIGRLYSSSDLAYYQKGEQFPSLLMYNVNASINSVLFPTMSQEQDNLERIKYITRRSIMSGTFIIMPMMAGLAACSTNLVRLILTEKWMPCVFFIRVFCITYSFFPLQNANLSAIKAMGRSDIFLKLEIIKKILGLFLLFFSICISVKAIALSSIVLSIISQIINSWPNKKFLNYSYFDQIYDILPQITISIIMGIIVFSVSLLKLSDITTICLQIPIGCLIYILCVKIFKIESGKYVETLIKNFVLEKRNNYK